MHFRSDDPFPGVGATRVDTYTSNMSAASPNAQPTRLLLAQALESLERAGVLQIGKVPAAVPRLEGSSPPAKDRPDSRAAQANAAQANYAAAPPSVRAAAVRTVAEEYDMARRKAAPSRPSAASLRNDPYPAGLADSLDERRLALDAIDQQVRVCTLCKDLACLRNKTVFGVGNVQPRVVFLGEAPGADEDRTGEPFVGRAGQLLTKIIEACTFKREDVYILNVLKCRPPDNRTPLPDEIARCRSYFERQFEILRPEYIVCAGSVAAQSLLETTETIGKLRGRFHTYRGSKVVATYHPSYLLRNPPAKKFVWDDMQMLLADMGIKLPGK